MTPAPQGPESWMPNGFPPPSFVVETERTRTFAGPRGRWLAAAAILGAILLITGIVLIARDDDGTDVASRSTTTAFAGTNPTFTPTSGLDPTADGATATIPPAGGDPNAPLPPPGNPGDPGGGGGVGGGGGTPAAPPPGQAPAPPPGASPGVIAADPGTVTLPTIDAADPAKVKQSGAVTLRNTGGSTLGFAAESNYSGLSASPANGSIGAGQSVVVNLVLDGSNAPERNPFSAQIRFAGSGGATLVTVNAVVRRPPSILPAGDAACPVQDGCSGQVSRSPGKGACDPAGWRIRVSVSDASDIKSVTAQVTNPDGSTRGVTLAKEGGTNVWVSDAQPKPPPGTTRFRVTATDVLDAVATGAEQSIICA